MTSKSLSLHFFNHFWLSVLLPAVFLACASNAIALALPGLSDLSAIISSAQVAHDAASEGTATGQYTIGAKGALQTVINNATTVRDNPVATAEEIAAAAFALGTALAAFESEKVIPTFPYKYEISTGSNADAATDSSGNVYAVYERSGSIFLSKNRRAEEVIPGGGSDSNASIAVEPAGTVHVAFSRGSVVYYAKQDTTGAWTVVEVTGGYTPDIDVDSSGHVGIVHMNTDQYRDVMFTTNSSGAFISSLIFDGFYWYESGSRAANYFSGPSVKIDSSGFYHVSAVLHIINGGMGWIDHDYSIAYRTNSGASDQGSGGFGNTSSVSQSKSSLALAGGSKKITYAAIGNVYEFPQSILTAGSGSAIAASAGVYAVSLNASGVSYLEDAGYGRSAAVVVDSSGSSSVTALSSTNRFVYFEKDGKIWLATDADLPLQVDTDGDGVYDHQDNCSLVSNPAQQDSDLDGAGDACDADDDNDSVADDADCQAFDNSMWRNQAYPDADNDSVRENTVLVTVTCFGATPPSGFSLSETAPDNCPTVANHDQTDTDADSQGDACDPDDDNDSVADVSDCQTLDNSIWRNQAFLDADGDGVRENTALETVTCFGATPPSGYTLSATGSDNCPALANPDQTDADADSQGDACDADDDNDSVEDVSDCQTLDNSIWRNQAFLDADGDGVRENTALETVTCFGATAPSGYTLYTTGPDNCPAVANTDQTDTDVDSQGDACDPDDDNDSIADGSDCQALDNSKWRNQAFLDADGDGVRENTALETVTCFGTTPPSGYTISAAGTDNCPVVVNSDQTDTDGDGQGDACEADLKELTAAIAAAQAKHDAASEGGVTGQYPLGAKATLQLAIDAALATRDDPGSTQDDVDSALAGLNDAVATFVAAQIVPAFPNRYEIATGANADAANDNSGNVYVVFEKAGSVYLRQNRKGEELVSAGSAPALAVDDSGNIHVIYENSGVKYRKRVGATWEAQREVTGSAVSFDIDTDSLGNPHVVYDIGNRGDVIYIKDEAGTWSAPIERFTGWYDSGSGTYFHNPQIRIDDDDFYHLGYNVEGWGGTVSWSNSYVAVTSNAPGASAGSDGFAWQAVRLGKNRLSLNASGLAEAVYADGSNIYRATISGGAWHQSLIATGRQESSSHNGIMHGVALYNAGIKYIENAGFGYTRTVDIDAAGVNPVVALSLDKRFVYFEKDGKIWLSTDADLPLQVDTDGDGVYDHQDNCPLVSNPAQQDSDLDGMGDSCDSDQDGDGVNNDVDNCPAIANAGQEDRDADGQGNVCDTDDDNDGVLDVSDCQTLDNSIWRNQAYVDADGDGVRENTVLVTVACFGTTPSSGYTLSVNGPDNCAEVSNPNQENTDADSQGNACDTDDDNDGVLDVADCHTLDNSIWRNQAYVDGDGDGIRENTVLVTVACFGTTPPSGCTLSLNGPDNCAAVNNPHQENTDGDSQGNVCDTDDDNDGVLDVSDCQTLDNSIWRNQAYRDADSDGVRENTALETVACFGTTLPSGYTLSVNEADNCPGISNPNQENTDADSQGNACDLDDDNDGVLDVSDCQTLDNNIWRNQAYRDADGDGVRENASLETIACFGTTPPSGYTLSANGPDNCPTIANSSQSDTDGDDLGDSCDALQDVDRDDIADLADNCPNDTNTNQLDTDADGQGNACDSDDDNDGVGDIQEATDGTNPLDGGSALFTLQSPTYVKYNTFLEQSNFLELVSVGTAPVRALVTVYSISGKLIGSPRNFKLNPGQQVDVDIVSWVNKADTYGLIKIEFNNSTAGANLAGRITIYREDLPGQDTPSGEREFSFAYARDFRNPSIGKTFAVSDTTSSDGISPAVDNWIELINLEGNKRKFTVKIYDRNGKLKSSTTKTVNSYGAVDIAGGQQYGEGVYLIEIIPFSANARYLASVTRYSTTDGAKFNYATTVDSRKATGEKLYVPVSKESGGCFSKTTEIDIINTLSSATSAVVKYRNRLGSVKKTQEISLKSRAQIRLDAGLLLAGVGSVEVAPKTENSLLVQGNVYFSECNTGATQAAYTAQALIAEKRTQSGSYNRFLSMNNYYLVTNTSNKSITFSLAVKDVKATVLSNRSYTLKPYGTVVLDLSDSATFKTKENSYGVATISAPANRALAIQSVRIRPLGNSIDYAMPTAVR